MVGFFASLFRDPKHPDKSGFIPVNWNRRFKPVNFIFSHKKSTTRTIQVKPKHHKDHEEPIFRSNSDDTVDDENDVFVRPTYLDAPSKHTIHVGSSKHKNKTVPDEDDEKTVQLNWKGIKSQPVDKKIISRQMFYFQKNEQKIKKILVKPKAHNHSHNQERGTRPHHITRKPQQTTGHKYHVSDIPWFDKTPPPETKRNKLFYWRDRW